MAKVKLNPIVESVRGQVGDLVFRNLRGDTILSSKPDFSGVEATAGQTANRNRFRQAVAYGQLVMADDNARELYEEAAERKGKPAFALMVADFMNVPSIDEVDLSQYGGQENDRIIIRTTDDFGVEEVSIMITDANGAELESGDAELDQSLGRWVYTGQTDLTTGTAIRVIVSVSDRPGGVNTSEFGKNI